MVCRIDRHNSVNNDIGILHFVSDICSRRVNVIMNLFILKERAQSAEKLMEKYFLLRNLGNTCQQANSASSGPRRYLSLWSPIDF